MPSRPNDETNKKKSFTALVEEAFLYIVSKIEPASSKTAPARAFPARGVKKSPPKLATSNNPPKLRENRVKVCLLPDKKLKIKIPLIVMPFELGVLKTNI